MHKFKVEGFLTLLVDFFGHFCGPSFGLRGNLNVVGRNGGSLLKIDYSHVRKGFMGLVCNVIYCQWKTKYIALDPKTILRLM